MRLCFHVAAWACLSAVVGFAADVESPASEQKAVPGTGSDTSSRFEPGEISIGEPLQVPFREPDTVVAPPSVPLPPRAPSTPQPTEPSAAPQFKSPPPATRFSTPTEPPAAGTGWLGLTVDDTLVPGRLVVVDVAAQGPAAKAGIVPQNTLLGINGSPLRTADELAASLAAISPGMNVKMAIGRGDRVDEVSVQAAVRPAAATPQWQALAEPSAAKLPEAATPRPAPFPAASPAPAAVPAKPAELPAPSLAPAQQSAKGRTALGVRTLPVDPDMQSRYRLPELSGAYVIGVVQDLPASKAGVPPGSVIVALGNQPVRDPEDLTRLVARGPVGAPVPLHYVLPGGESRHAEVMLQSLETPLERALIGPDSPADVPATLPPPTVPQQARRAVTLPDGRGSPVKPATAASPPPATAIEEEVRLLRQRVESLERRLERTIEGSERGRLR